MIPIEDELHILFVSVSPDMNVTEMNCVYWLI